MKEAFPNYYHKFECIKDKCRHNCCIGWEIDIDEDTMALYRSLDTEMGERIRENIEGDVPHFILQEGDRCPFLNRDGLCEIIIAYGEDAICDICYMHPRFKNFYPSFTETGLGLCCEEAARVVLTGSEKFSIDTPSGLELTNTEKYFLEKRREIFSLIQDREKTIGNRLSLLAEKFGLKFNFSIEKLYSGYGTLERLYEVWTDELDGLKDFDFDGEIFNDEKLQIPFEQLAVYFIFRHLWDNVQIGDYTQGIKFLLVSCFLIGALCSYHKYKNGSISMEKVIDIIRMYSAEVEYSEENMAAIMSTDFA